VYLYNRIKPTNPTAFGITYKPVNLASEKKRNIPRPHIGLVSLTKVRAVDGVSIIAGKSSL
jgi:hypothetical protein